MNGVNPTNYFHGNVFITRLTVFLMCMDYKDTNQKAKREV